MINLLIKDPFVIAQITGSSLEALKLDAFSAPTAKSSPKIPAVFFVATLVIIATSSINAAISSKSAKNPDIYLNFVFNKKTNYWELFSYSSLKILLLGYHHQKSFLLIIT